MKKILESVTNPFSIEKFEKLLNIFLNSKDYNQFYTKVVTHFDDRQIGGIPQYITTCDRRYVRPDKMPGWNVLRYFIEFFQTEHRIYINSPAKHIGTILRDFVSQCEAANLPFELKYDSVASSDRNDTIVIGSNTSVYKKQEILQSNTLKLFKNAELLHY